jgi:hypothetical protein
MIVVPVTMRISITMVIGVVAMRIAIVSITMPPGRGWG